ncbi:MAG: hypothetical protein IH587_03445, partial [Anaerolineae bacterium]|nr:hypothetical protein [Anaerolineae bacterium]
FAPDLTNLETMTSFSDDDLFVIISEGQGTDMVGLADILADDQRRDVAAYVRTFTLANSDAIGEQAQPPSETAEPGTLTTGLIRGQVANGSAGGIVPADLSLTLVYFGEDLQQTSIETTADSGGNYEFDDVPISADLRYAVAVNYRERTFVSDIVAGTSQAAALDVPVTIYELTEDPGVITIDRMVAQVNAVGDSLEITQVFTLRNHSDRAYTTSQMTSDGRALSVVISLPPGSVIWGFPDNADRYVAIQEQFAVADTLPVLPGEDHVVAVVYIIPYDNGAIIEQPLNYAFVGVARVLLRPESLRLQSDQLQSIGAQTVGETQWQGYSGDLSTLEGDVLRYELSGETQSAGARDGGAVVSSNNLLPLLICGALAEIVLVVGLYLWYRRRRQRNMAASPATDQALIDALVRQIAELDAAFERGEIDVDEHRKQRGHLKGRLADLMDRAGSD